MFRNLSQHFETVDPTFFNNGFNIFARRGRAELATEDETEKARGQCAKLVGPAACGAREAGDRGRWWRARRCVTH
jgi:hypothetical protein